MNIFISWSGEQSKEMALALHSWLPQVLQHVHPWLSNTDIAAGERWSLEVSKQLEGSNFGILCLTRENLQAPWILFEAGALAKSLSTGSVCPYLLDVDFGDISGPLAQFQAKKVDKEQTLQLLMAINSKSSMPIDENRLTKSFETFWPELHANLLKIKVLPTTTQPLRSQAEILEDVVSSIRSLDQRLDSLAEQQHKELAEYVDKRLTETLAAPHKYSTGPIRAIHNANDSKPRTHSLTDIPQIKPQDLADLLNSPIQEPLSRAKLTEEYHRHLNRPSYRYRTRTWTGISRYLVLIATGVTALFFGILAWTLSTSSHESRPNSSTLDQTAFSPKPYPPSSSEASKAPASFVKYTRVRSPRYIKEPLEACGIDSEAIAAIIWQERRTSADTQGPMEQLKHIQKKYGLRDDGFIGTETTFLLLALGLKRDRKALEVKLRNCSGLPSWKPIEAAIKICAQDKTLAREIKELFVIFYDFSVSIPGCSDA